MICRPDFSRKETRTGLKVIRTALEGTAWVISQPFEPDDYHGPRHFVAIYPGIKIATRKRVNDERKKREREGEVGSL